jgi:hypothetical protein
MSHETLTATAEKQVTIESNFALWQQRAAALEVGYAETGTYPPEWYDKKYASLARDIETSLADETIDPAYISRYYELTAAEVGIRNKISGSVMPTSPLSIAFVRLGESTIARGFSAETDAGPLHEAVKSSLDEQYIDSALLTMLKQAYGVDTATDLLGVHGDEYADELRGSLLKKSPLARMRYMDERRDPDFTWTEMQAAARDWMAHAITAATGVSPAEAADYAFSLSRRGMDSEEHTADVITKMNHFGPERLKKLADVTGIYGLETYSLEQLERMVSFVDNPEATAENLAHHDVSVAMVNRFGDYSGVLHRTAADIDDQSGRTLFFEIANMADIYRHMITLKKAGIKPSTLLLAAHSAVGRFFVADERVSSSERRRVDFADIAGKRLVASVVETENDKQPGVLGYSMHGMAGLARIVEDYMQPSRAIDDDETDQGRKKIIFSACHAGAETELNDLDDADEKYQVEMDSVVGRLGKDLQASDVSASVDIYGAPDGMQMHRTEHGVRYSGQPVDGVERIPLHAVRVRLEAGNLSKTEVDDILLRKAV